MLLGFKLVVEDQLVNAVFANDISLPALKKAQKILFNTIFLAHLQETFCENRLLLGATKSSMLGP